MTPAVLRERAAQAGFAAAAGLSIVAVALICVFPLRQRRTRPWSEIGLGRTFCWAPPGGPAAAEYGIFPMIVGSLYVTAGRRMAGRRARGAPLRPSTSRVLCQQSAPAALLRPAVELLAGIPSVVYGFFGLVLIVPSGPREPGRPRGNGSCILGRVASCSAIMILPTIITVAKSALDAVPDCTTRARPGPGGHPSSAGGVRHACPPRKSRRAGRGGAGRWPRHRRDDGRDHGGGQPAPHPRQAARRRAHPHRQHRAWRWATPPTCTARP